MQFQKAIRKKSKLRLGITGPAGSGKTYSSLLIAKGIGGKIAVIDTEKGSASLYNHIVDFDTLDLEAPYSPERYIQAIMAAEEAGYSTLIIDSITHEWNGVGGCLEINEQVVSGQKNANSWAAWNKTTPRHRRFIDSILQSKMHIIATMRSKTETVQGEDKKIRKVGMKSEQRDGIEYEMTTILELSHESKVAIPTKDRTGLFDPENPQRVTERTGRLLSDWLEQGEDDLKSPSSGQSYGTIQKVQQNEGSKTFFTMIENAWHGTESQEHIDAIKFAQEMKTNVVINWEEREFKGKKYRHIINIEASLPKEKEGRSEAAMF